MMNTVSEAPASMPDVQSSLDERQVAIQRVGVRGVRYPMALSLVAGQATSTVADWELTVALAEHEKGTHMSRFMALLEQHRDTPSTPQSFMAMAREMLTLLEASQGDISARFPVFLEKQAPVSGVSSLLDYSLGWTARVGAQAEQDVFELSLLVPVTSLCPCSKAISKYGAHNQRSHVTVTICYTDVQSIQVPELIRQIEQQASCELWGLLKRTDEKYVTERAYENPKFVEDLVRDVAMLIKQQAGVRHFRVEAENFESIHNHSAYACVEG